MKKTVATLADGREIIYFDESDDTCRALMDTRDLPDMSTSSEIRFDPLRREWVVIASHRQSRTHLPTSDDCPLCPSTQDRPTEVPSSAYDVVVFENRFPAFTGHQPCELEDLGDPLFARRRGAGRCEVVCFADDHDLALADLSPQRVRTVVEAWSDRTQALSELPHVEQVFCFENRGADIGVTLHHPHGQIYAYPFVTPRTQRVLDSAHRYRERTWRNLFADVLAAEQRDQMRIVRQTQYWTAFVPAAARWPIEIHLYPNRQVPDLPALSDAERDDFCPLYLDLLGRMDALFDQRAPYVAAWHQAPVRFQRDLAYLHLELFSIRRAPGKLKYLAGSESAMGVFVNDIAPEVTAQRLRETLNSPTAGKPD
jgi:UDPglucose--hexose-1-phosphate uridylyltransferase